MYQAFRQELTGKCLHIEARYHQDSDQHVVLWGDILQVFPHAIRVDNGNIVSSWARDREWRVIDPRCIVYQPGKVLDIVMENSSILPAILHYASRMNTVPTQPDVANEAVEDWVMSTNTILMQDEIESVYASSVCSGETTDGPHFRRLNVPTETDASDNEGKETMKPEMPQSTSHDAELDSILDALRRRNRKRPTVQKIKKGKQISSSAPKTTTDGSSNNNNSHIGSINIRGGSNNNNGNARDDNQDDDYLLSTRIGGRPGQEQQYSLTYRPESFLTKERFTSFKSRPRPHTNYDSSSPEPEKQQRERASSYSNDTASAERGTRRLRLRFTPKQKAFLHKNYPRFPWSDLEGGSSDDSEEDDDSEDERRKDSSKIGLKSIGAPPLDKDAKELQGKSGRALRDALQGGGSPGLGWQTPSHVLDGKEQSASASNGRPLAFSPSSAEKNWKEVALKKQIGLISPLNPAHPRNMRPIDSVDMEDGWTSTSVQQMLDKMHLNEQ